LYANGKCRGVKLFLEINWFALIKKKMAIKWRSNYMYNILMISSHFPV
jgi:hypothetical protein